MNRVFATQASAPVPLPLPEPVPDTSPLSALGTDNIDIVSCYECLTALEDLCERKKCFYVLESGVRPNRPKTRVTVNDD